MGVNQLKKYFFGKWNLRGKTGFTLIELLVYIVLIGIFLTIIVTFAYNIIEGKVKTEAMREVEASARISLNRISYEIKKSIGINGVNKSSLSLNMADPSEDPTVIYSWFGMIIMRKGSGPVQYYYLTAPSLVKVKDLTFTNNSAPQTNGNIGVSITIERNTSVNRSQYNASITLQDSISLRQ